MEGYTRPYLDNLNKHLMDASHDESHCSKEHGVVIQDIQHELKTYNTMREEEKRREEGGYLDIRNYDLTFRYKHTINDNNLEKLAVA